MISSVVERQRFDVDTDPNPTVVYVLLPVRIRTRILPQHKANLTNFYFLNWTSLKFKLQKKNFVQNFVLERSDPVFGSHCIRINKLC